MLRCSCGSSIPRSLCKLNENNKLICPVCNKVEEHTPLKVSLRKDDMELEIPIQVKEQNGVVSTSSTEGLVNAIDNGIRSFFGDTISVCPVCNKAICICSLKDIFKGIGL